MKGLEGIRICKGYSLRRVYLCMLSMPIVANYQIQASISWHGQTDHNILVLVMHQHTIVPE